MKIVFIGQKGVPARFGGVERHVTDLAVRLVELGHEVMAYTRPNYTDPDLREYKGIKLLSLPCIATKNLDAISHTFVACLDLIFRRRKVDIIHFHSIGPSSLIFMIRIFMPFTPVVSTFHTQCYFHKKWSGFARLYLKAGEYVSCNFSHALIVVSKTLKKYTKKKYGVDAVNIPNGTYPATILPVNIIREKWGLEKDSYILLVSRLIRHKGIHYAIEAYKKLNTDKKLVIVGGGFFTDKYVSELKEMSKNDNNIILVGEQVGDALSELFSNAYLFVQPSESEGLSIALLEAMSYSKAVIVSDIPENKEVVKDFGITFRNKDIRDLVGRMEFSLKNPDVVKSCGEKGKKHVDENYNWDDIVFRTVGLYKDLVKESR